MSSKLKEEIWVIADNRPGTFNQAISLAKSISMPYRIIEIEYNFLAKIPNFLNFFNLWCLSKKTRNSLNSIGYYPRVIISAGRRGANIALAIKRNSNNESKIVQIMNPQLPFRLFDNVLLPQHDPYNSYRRLLKQGGRGVLIKINGALNSIDPKMLQVELAKFSLIIEEKLQDSYGCKIAVLVGGNYKNKPFPVVAIKELLQDINFLKKENDKVLIVNSRRTSDKINQFIKDHIAENNNYCFFNFHDYVANNPYLAILALADIIVVTGDSVSMVSDALATGKELYIFNHKDIASAKHRQFHSNLFDLGLARLLPNNNCQLPTLPKQAIVEHLSETAKLGNYLRCKFFS
jgi:mitochondrial fission protein ELM1